jgi:flagellar basal body rod protein FlgG
MNYGLYLSATGVSANSHRIDVLANNLANAETGGFKRELTAFQARPAPAETKGRQGDSNPMLDLIGGGIIALPSRLDTGQGVLEPTSNPLDLGINGKGYFQVQDAGGEKRLTRDGRMMLDRDGYLVTANDPAAKVLGENGEPVKLQGFNAMELNVDQRGSIRATGNPAVLATVGVVDVPPDARLVPIGNSMLAAPDGTAFGPASGLVRGGVVERSNVEPATELTQMMNASRLLEMNANMLRFQDQATGRLVSEVGKIG